MLKWPKEKKDDVNKEEEKNKDTKKDEEKSEEAKKDEVKKEDIEDELGFLPPWGDIVDDESTKGRAIQF